MGVAWLAIDPFQVMRWLGWWQSCLPSVTQQNSSASWVFDVEIWNDSLWKQGVSCAILSHLDIQLYIYPPGKDVALNVVKRTTFLSRHLFRGHGQFFLGERQTIELPPTLDASHHQDYEPFSGSGIPSQSFICDYYWVGGSRPILGCPRKLVNG